MVQIARPNSDVNVVWGAVGAGTRWEAIDEVTPDDAASYMVAGTDQDTQKIGLANLNDPYLGSGHTVRVRQRPHKAVGAGAITRVQVLLYEGTTYRANCGAFLSGGWESWETDEYTLSEAEANGITDYTNLILWFVASNITEGETNIQVTWAELEVPDVGIIAPTGTTDPATSVESAQATLNGTLDDDGGEACDCGFEWGETDAYGNTTPTESKVTGETFSQAISGLDADTTYHFRAIVTNSAGISYGSDVTFTTVALSTVTTDPATPVTGITATLHGTLDADGGEACDCGFEWGLTTAYGNTTATQSKVTGETFSQAISGLAGLTTYHFRALSTNSAGESNGADRTFITEVAMPSATTDPATGVGMAVATINGTLDDDGGEATDCSFQWGLTTAYGNNTPSESKVTGETFAQALSGLDAGTTYHFRTAVNNSAGTSYGADRTFTTTTIAEQIGRGFALGRHEL